MIYVSISHTRVWNFYTQSYTFNVKVSEFPSKHESLK